MRSRPSCPHEQSDCLSCALTEAERARGTRLASLSVVEGADPARWRAIDELGTTGEGATPVEALRTLASSDR